MNLLNITEKNKKDLLKDLINSKELRDELDSLYSDPQIISIWHLVLLAKESLTKEKKSDIMLTEVQIKDFKEKLKNRLTSKYRKAEAQFKIFLWLNNFKKGELEDYLGTYIKDEEFLKFIIMDLIYAQFMSDDNFRNSIFRR